VKIPPQFVKSTVCIVGGVLLAALVYIGIFLYKFGSYENSETGRFSSPNDAIDAVTVERLINATVATPSLVYVLPKGMPISGNPVFLADHVDGLVVTWKDDVTLLVHADRGRIYPANLKDHAVVKVNGKQETVTVNFDIVKQEAR